MKLVDLETSVDMLELLLDEQTYPFISPFKRYLQEQKSYRCMNKDQWLSFLEFCKTIEEDFSNYDENGSCKYTSRLKYVLLSLTLHYNRASYVGRICRVGKGSKP